MADGSTSVHVAESSPPGAASWSVSTKSYLAASPQARRRRRRCAEDYRQLSRSPQRQAAADPGRRLGKRRYPCSRPPTLDGPLIASVIALGLPRRIELGWRYDSYLRHHNPNEPTFSTAAIIDRWRRSARRHSFDSRRIRVGCRGPEHSAKPASRRSCGLSRHRTIASAATFLSSMPGW